ncbi:MAG: signal peptide peptidase SppA, partial [Kiritimatiellae bacterium]|nr:signal peptide peptidase SppA [Kiritimatiellia bacterium]
MDPNTQKGCMIGCLSSVGMFAGFVVLAFVLSALALRGCTQAISTDIGADGDTTSPDGELKPQDEKPFRKVWLSSRGGAKSAHVLKVRLHGIIASSFERNVFSSSEDTSAPTALRKIRAATRDKSIRGLYLDIDSPGGGVTMSDELHDAILRFRASGTNRFVFVHMGDLCCSGGYYAAAPADCIMARPTTITGSIGVVMSTVNIAELADNIGIEGVTIASGGNKDLLNPLKPVDTNHVAILQRPIRHLYDRFVGIVAKGRKLPAETVRKLADGRVFSAGDAVKNKLVDCIGHEADAVNQLKKLAGGDVRIYGYSDKNDLRSFFENALIFESADGIIGKLRAALDAGTTPRAEYRAR